MPHEIRLLIGGTTDGGTTDGGTTDGGSAGRTANSMFAGASTLPPLISARRLGWGVAVEGSAPPANFGGEFPADGWDPLMKAGVIAGQFAAKSQWMTVCDPGYPPDHPMNKESLKKAAAVLGAKSAMVYAQENLIAELHEIKKRSLDLNADSGDSTRRIFEVRSQESAFAGDFFRLASCSAEVRRAAFCLILVGIQIGALVCSHFKMKYKRQRPAQAWPTIDPAIATPRHPSYPSGHAMQAHLVAQLLGEINAGLAIPAKALATRIAENREVAGVHYPSDSQASEFVVGKIMECLGTFDDPEFRDLVRDAKAEMGSIVQLDMTLTTSPTQ